MCGGQSSSTVISMPVKSTWGSSKEEVTRIALVGPWLGHPGVEDTFHSYWSPSASASPCQTTKIGLTTGTVFANGPDVPHSYDTCSWPPLYEPWGLQTAELLPALWPEYGGDRGYPDGVWISSPPLGWPFPLPSWHSLPCLRSCTLWEEIHSIKTVSIGSSCCTATQSITCKFTYMWAVCTWMEVSSTCLCILLLASATVGSWVLALPAVPMVTPSRMDFTASAFSFDTSNSIVSSFLIFDAKSESCQWLHPMMLGGI